MKRGAELRDGFANPDYIKVVKYYDKEAVIHIAFHEGRNRLVKRFLSEFGHPVLKLKRMAVGPIKLGNLPGGKWRELTKNEILTLENSIG
jgi:23S rRNA pseudouridine2605 synthase